MVDLLLRRDGPPFMNAWRIGMVAAKRKPQYDDEVITQSSCSTRPIPSRAATLATWARMSVHVAKVKEAADLGAATPLSHPGAGDDPPPARRCVRAGSCSSSRGWKRVEEVDLILPDEEAP